MDSLTLVKSRSNYEEESNLSNAVTADSSPFNHCAKGKQSFRSSHRSKFSKTVAYGCKLSFNTVDSEHNSCVGVSEFSSNKDLELGVNSISNTFQMNKKQLEKSEFKIFFLIPVELLDKTPINLSQTQKIKNGFIIDFVDLRVVSPNSKVVDLIEIALKKINESLVGRFDYYFSLVADRYSLRPNKRSGLPDFDLPGKF